MKKSTVILVLLVALLVAVPLSADIDFRHKFERATQVYVVTNVPEDSPVIATIRTLWNNQGPEDIQVLPWEGIAEHAQALKDPSAAGNSNAIYVFVTERGSRQPDWANSVGLVDPRLVPGEAVPGEMVWSAVWAKMERGKYTRYQQICVVAPTTRAAVAQLQYLAMRKGVPLGVTQRPAYFVAVFATSAAMGAAVSPPPGMSSDLVDALVFSYDQWSDFLAAREGRHEVWVIDGSRWPMLPAEVHGALPKGLVDAEACEAMVAEPGLKTDGHVIRVYYAPASRHLESLLSDLQPRRIPLSDLRDVTPIAFIGLRPEGYGLGHVDVGWVNELVTERLFALARESGISVVERAALETLAREHQIVLSGFVDESSAVQIGKWLSAKAVLLGVLSSFAGETEWRVEEYRRRDGTVEKWAWHFVQHEQESARVDGTLRLISVETGEQLWTAPLQAAYFAPDRTMGEFKVDEVAGRKPSRPSKVREGSERRVSSDTLAVTLSQAMTSFWRSASAHVLWPSDGKKVAAAVGAEEVWGEVVAVEAGEVFVSFPEESAAVLQPGLVLYVLREVVVGEVIFYRFKAAVQVSQVQGTVAACSIVEKAEDTTIAVGDPVSTVKEPTTTPF